MDAKVEKSKELAPVIQPTQKVEVFKPPYNTMTEAAMYTLHLSMSPPKGRELEFTNMPPEMVFPLVMSKVRQAAADPTRNLITNPLSDVLLTTYCAIRCSVGATRKIMMAGQLANSKMTGDDTGDMGALGNPSNRTRI